MIPDTSIVPNVFINVADPLTGVDVFRLSRSLPLRSRRLQTLGLGCALLR
jgi:hypothetical protein